MLEPITNSKYKKDTKRLKKQGKDKKKLVEVLEKLVEGIPLEKKYREHYLSSSSNYSGCLECHIEPDWLLIYRIDTKEQKLYLVRTGSHAEVFNEDISSDASIPEITNKLKKILNEED